MSARSIRPALALAVALSLVSMAPAAAAAPASVTFSMVRDLATGSDTWSSTGAITDAGSFTADPEFFAGRSVTLHGRRIVSGAEGSLTLLFNVRLIATPDPDVFDVAGSWTALGGTGAYVGVHGAGDVAEAFDAAAGTVIGEWSGFIVGGS